MEGNMHVAPRQQRSSMQPKVWVFKEPMVVMPVGSVVQAAVTMGNGTGGRSATPYEAEAAARQLVKSRGVSERAKTPEEAVREAKRIYSEVHQGDGLCVDLRATPRNVVVSRSPTPAMTATHYDDPRYSDLQNEVALLRDELMRADHRKDLELQQARDELRNATHLLHQFTRQNAELQSRLATQDPMQAPRTKRRSNTITLKEMTRLQQPTPQAPPPQEAGLNAMTLADYSHQDARYAQPPPPPPQDDPYMYSTQPQAQDTFVAPPERRQSEILTPPPPAEPMPYAAQPARDADNVSVHSMRSVRSHKSSASATQARMGRPNTAIACENDEVDLDMQSVHSMRSVRSHKSSASATQARMGRPNTAIACENDEVDLDMQSVGGRSQRSVRSQVAPQAVDDDVQSVHSMRSVRSHKSSASATQARMGRPNTAIACENDEVDLDFGAPAQPDDDAASHVSRVSAKSSASATKTRMKKGNTAIACDNDEVDLEL